MNMLTISNQTDNENLQKFFRFLYYTHARMYNRIFSNSLVYIKYVTTGTSFRKRLRALKGLYNQGWIQDFLRGGHVIICFDKLANKKYLQLKGNLDNYAS